MKLSIDTTSADKITITLNGDVLESEAKQNASQKLLPFIISELGKRNMTLSDVKEIHIKTSGGSFTGLRVGTAIAQTLAWSLDIPINGIHVGKDASIKITYPTDLIN